MTFRDVARDYLVDTYDLKVGPDGEWQMPLGKKPGQLTHLHQCIKRVKDVDRVLGHLAVDQIDQKHIADALRPYWKRVPATARKMRGLLWQIIQTAYAKRLRSHPFNPADEATIIAILRRNTNAKASTNYASLPWEDAPRILGELHGWENKVVEAIVLEIAMRLGMRLSEITLANWEEIDLESGIWTIADKRMKQGKFFRVPLPQAAITLLRRLKDRELAGHFVFPSRVKRGEPLGKTAVAKLIIAMGYGPGRVGHFTTHGMRATFRTWVEDKHPAYSDLAKAALAHTTKDKVDERYQRSDLLERRRVLMELWNGYLDNNTAAPSNVVPLHRAA